MGGVGKTAICRTLAHKCAKQVNAVIWLGGDSGLEGALQNVIAPKLNIDIQHPDWTELLMDRLNQYDPPSVLFLDNLEQSESNSVTLNILKRLNWHLVATSRCPLPEFTNRHEVDLLSLEECTDLFIQHYEMPINKTDQATLKELIALAGHHTLTIELLAKIAKDGFLDVSELFEQVKQTGFDLRSLTDTVADGLHSGTELQSKRQHQLHEHLSKLFQLAHLPHDEKTILRILAILPYQTYHGKNELMVWLGLDKPQLLINLAKKGWLQRTGQHFSVHPVVADVTKHQISLDPATLCQFSEQFNQSIEPKEDGHWIKQAGYAKPLEALISVLPKQITITADLQANLARIYKAKGLFTEALPLYQKVLMTQENIHDQDQPEVAAARNNLGFVYEALGNYDQASYFYKLALASDLKILGENHPNVAIARSNLAAVLLEQYQYDYAIDLYHLALDSDIVTFGIDHTIVARRYSNLGRAYEALGLCIEAIEMYEMALTIDIKKYGVDHPEVTLVLTNMGTAYNALGFSDIAIELHQFTLDADLKTFGEDHYQVATHRNNLGVAYHSSGQYDEAKDCFQQALITMEKLFEPQHPIIKTTKQNLAEAQLAKELKV